MAEVADYIDFVNAVKKQVEEWDGYKKRCQDAAIAVMEAFIEFARVPKDAIFFTDQNTRGKAEPRTVFEAGRVTDDGSFQIAMVLDDQTTGGDVLRLLTRAPHGRRYARVANFLDRGDVPIDTDEELKLFVEGIMERLVSYHRDSYRLKIEEPERARELNQDDENEDDL